MMLAYLELLFSVAALKSVNVVRNVDALGAIVPPLPILGYAY